MTVCLHARLGWLGAVLEEGAQAGRVAAGDVGEARAEVELLAEQLRSTVGRGEGQGVRRAVRGESEGKGEGRARGRARVGVGGLGSGVEPATVLSRPPKVLFSTWRRSVRV